MKSLGLDIGTTSISAVVVENGKLLKSQSVKNDSFILNCENYERIQDVSIIEKKALALVGELLELFPDVSKIGVTGQMHGIVYLNHDGTPVSPLYTWQDGRGELEYRNGETYVQHLSRLTGYSLAAGYGIVTHFYHLQNGSVPDSAKVFCTIHDYMAMVLAGNTVPVTDTGDAASFGMFDLRSGVFDTDAMKKAGIDTSFLPEIAGNAPIGMYEGRIAVYPAIGDNQASFIGACGGRKNVMLCNVGTGGQFSVYSQDYMECEGLETRPFPGGGYLLAGSSLCSGRAYAILEKFFRITAEMLGADRENCYSDMEAMLERNTMPENLPVITTLFSGTRENPSLRGSITGLSDENFTPLHFIYGMMYGIADELYGMYEKYIAAGGERVDLIGSGNGLRKNRYLKRCFEEKFAQPLNMSNCEEEAAAGAAVYTGIQGGYNYET